MGKTFHLRPIGSGGGAPGNHAPVITAPTGNTSITEGEYLWVPFTTTDQDNDKVTHTIQYLIGGVVQGSLPTGATYRVLTNGSRGLNWWPTLAQAGTYAFRFLAQDEHGASATPIDINVTVNNRTTNPTLLSIKSTGQMPPSNRDFYPGDVISVRETTYLGLVMIGTDPEADNISMTIAGITSTYTLTESPANQFNLAWLAPYGPAGQHPSAGDYLLTATVSDGTNTFDVQFTARQEWSWRHDDEHVHVEPRSAIGSGLVRAATRGGAGNWMSQIVRGNVTFTPHAYNAWQANYVPNPAVPSDMYWKLVLNTPDANGRNVRTYISSLKNGLNTVTWDSTTIADGTYSISYEFCSGSGTMAVDITRYVSQPATIIVDNDVAPETGAQWLPIDYVEDVGYRFRWRGPMEAVQWFHYDGDPTTKHTVHAFPYAVASPPTTTEERNALIPTTAWVGETILGPLINRYTFEPMVAKTTEGHPHIGYATWEGFDESYPGGVIRFWERDGGRLNASISGYTQFRSTPGSDPSYVGVGPEGRLVKIDPSQTGAALCVTLAGYRIDGTVLPLYDDGGNYITQQKELVGTFDNDSLGNDLLFNMPLDLVFDPDDSNVVYIADRWNHRIAKAVLNTGAVTTYAGDVMHADAYGKPAPGYLDGARLSALFDNPCSVEIIGRNLYVADKENCCIRAINLDTGVVSTPVGKGINAPDVPAETVVFANYASWTFSSISFDDTPIVYPFFIRKTSDSKLVLQEFGNEGRGTSNLRIIDFTNSLVTQLYRTYGETFQCDDLGNVGPIDDILFRSGSLSTGFRLSIAGTLRGQFVTSGSPMFYGSGDSYLTFTEGGSTYPTSMVIDNAQAKIGFPSVYRGGFTIIRPRLVGDPSATHNAALYDEGRVQFILGTVVEFAQHRDRPGFGARHGRFGHNWLQDTPTFDDLTSQTDAQLATYIRAGMATGVPRPELTARALQSLIYYIRMTSIEGKTTTVSDTAIATNLQNAGHWPTDSDPPEVRSISVTHPATGSVTISWLTDELCVCLLFFNQRSYFGNWQSNNNNIESSLKSPITDESQSHSVTLENLEVGHTYYYKIKARDRGGNVTVTDVGSFSAD